MKKIFGIYKCKTCGNTIEIELTIPEPDVEMEMELFGPYTNFQQQYTSPTTTNISNLVVTKNCDKCKNEQSIFVLTEFKSETKK